MSRLAPGLAGARWGGCAVALAAALALVVPATTTSAPAQPAARKKKGKKTPVSVCAHFDQVDRDEEDGVDLVVANRCDVRLACSVSWTLTCEPDTRKASRFQRAAAFGLDVGSEQRTLAGTGDCGHHGWVIDDVSWSCRPEP